MTNLAHMNECLFYSSKQQDIYARESDKEIDLHFAQYPHMLTWVGQLGSIILKQPFMEKRWKEMVNRQSKP